MDWKEFVPIYRKFISRKAAYCVLLLLGLCVLLIIAPVFGQFKIPMGEVYDIILTHLTGGTVESYGKDRAVWGIRLPNAITAVVVGFALGSCGAVMQSLLRNPLADPYTMGISSGASLGAALFFVMGISVLPFLSGDYAMIANAFILSLIPTGIAILISCFRRMSTTAIILAGIAVMYTFGAITSTIMLIANPTQLSQVYMWNLGNIGTGSWGRIGLIVVLVAVCTSVLMVMNRKIDILTGSDDMAKTVGMNPMVCRMSLMVLISLMVAVIVSFTGTIGFIGLVGPHLARIFVGSSSRHLIPASGFTGAMLLLISQCIAINLGSLPIGVITSLIGCPVFLTLLIKQRNSEWN